MIKKRYSIILSIIASIQSILLLIVPFFSKYLVDEAISLSKSSDKDYDKLILYISVISSVIVLSIIVRIIYNLLYNKFDLKLEFEIRNKLYQSLIHKDVSEINKFHIGEIDALFHKDIPNLIESNIIAIPSITRQMVRCAVALGMLIYIDTSRWFLVGIIAFGIFSLILARIYSKMAKPLHKNVLEKDNLSSSFVVETINAGYLVQSYDAMDRAYDYYLNLNNEANKEKRKRNRLTVGANSFIFAVVNGTYAIAIIVGGILISKDILTYGSLVALVQLLSNIEYPFMSISSYLNKYNLGKVSSERISNIFNLKNINKDFIINDFDKIKIENLSYTYDGINYVINNLSYEINKGDILRIAGPSGIGKTTLFMLILGFRTPTNGSITFEYNYKKYKASNETINLISYVSQDNILFSGTILDNIKILTGVDDIETINNALREVNLYDELISLKNGLNTVLKDKGEGLSKGQLQRLIIAISLLYDKPIMLLDEFSSALDTNNEKIIINNLMKKNKTIIFITHRDINIGEERILKIGE